MVGMQALKAFFDNKLAHLHRQVAASDSRCVEILKENERAASALTNCQSRVRVLEAQLLSSQELAREANVCMHSVVASADMQFQDEISSVRANYEAQVLVCLLLFSIQPNHYIFVQIQMLTEQCVSLSEEAQRIEAQSRSLKSSKVASLCNPCSLVRLDCE